MPIKVQLLQKYGSMIIVSDEKGCCVGIMRTFTSTIYVFHKDVPSWKGFRIDDLQIDHNQKNDTSRYDRYEHIKISIPEHSSVYFTLTVPICCSCNDVAVKKCDDCIVESTFSFYCKNCFDDKHKKDRVSSHNCIDII